MIKDISQTVNRQHFLAAISNSALEDNKKNNKNLHSYTAFFTHRFESHFLSHYWDKCPGKGWRSHTRSEEELGGNLLTFTCQGTFTAGLSKAWQCHPEQGAQQNITALWETASCLRAAPWTTILTPLQLQQWLAESPRQKSFLHHIILQFLFHLSSSLLNQFSLNVFFLCFINWWF